MGRQLFLHHYLPAHLASSLVTGAILEFIFCIDPAPLEDAAFAVATDGGNRIDAKLSKMKDPNAHRNMGAHERLGGQSLTSLWAASGVVLAAVIFGWYWFLPLTYGKPGLDVSGVLARKWLNYDLHFAK